MEVLLGTYAQCPSQMQQHNGILHAIQTHVFLLFTNEIKAKLIINNNHLEIIASDDKGRIQCLSRFNFKTAVVTYRCMVNALDNKLTNPEAA